MDRNDRMDLELVDRIDLVGCHFDFPFKGHERGLPAIPPQAAADLLPRIRRRLPALPELGNPANGPQHVQHAAPKPSSRNTISPQGDVPAQRSINPTDADTDRNSGDELARKLKRLAVRLSSLQAFGSSFPSRLVRPSRRQRWLQGRSRRRSRSSSRPPAACCCRSRFSGFVWPILPAIATSPPGQPVNRLSASKSRGNIVRAIGARQAMRISRWQYRIYAMKSVSC